MRHISEVIEEMKPLEVELPVCPECHRVGKLPLYQGRMHNSCTGPAGESHKKATMKARLFREVIES